MGVYPLLNDETCWFLAVDFDGRSWQEDSAALRETSRTMGVPCGLERSRSGEGAHAWIFFTAPVPAATAREMGCHLLTETMANRGQLGMRSYDRLFPNQDTLPRGGFGNLIALPLQYHARQENNTVFLGDDLEPYADQWAFLASVSRLPPSQAEALARQAGRRGRILNVRPSTEGEDAERPWERPPSGERLPAIRGPLPEKVEAVLGQRLFLDTSDMPAALLSQLRRLAAFPNPEFHQRQRMRLSTRLTPRVIDRSEDDSGYLAVPRGCLPDVDALLNECGIELRLADEREGGEPIDLTFHGELTDEQGRAVGALLEHEFGVLVAPPGFGKTVVGACLAARRGCGTLILVHRQPLLDQWVAQLALFLGIEQKEIGRIGGGKHRPTGRLDVATLQSLVRKGAVADRVANYGHVIVDECHHVPAHSFERVLSEVKAQYITGLTATPQRRDGHYPILEMQLGPPRFRVACTSGTGSQGLRHRLIPCETGLELAEPDASAGIQVIYAALARDEARNTLIAGDVIAAVDEGRCPLVLTERKEHLSALAERLTGFVRHLVVCHGGMGARQRRAMEEQLATIPEDEERVVLATGRYVGEGFDDARLDTLFLTMPIAWRGTVTQYAGRLHRRHGGKREVRIYDYVDRDIPVLARMYEKRRRAYRAMGYMEDRPDGKAGPEGAKQLTLGVAEKPDDPGRRRRRAE